ncbi:patatin-like phospholipase family protein [Candidatus Peregrinibacteria bacterium]|nr:patatin-like phospholipase family protein [Candidatus Peregrinibacteria bacterium]
MKKEPKIGLALGGGGAKGAAHIGVLKVFEKYGITISSIAGASVGSIIGSAAAMGLKAEQILEINKKFNTRKFIKISNFRLFSDSLIKAKDINKAIVDLVGEATFKDTVIPFLAVAVDLESGEEVVLREGKLWEAARASSAIPFIFSPQFFQGRYLVDGGLLNNVPVDHLREQKDLDIIIGVELGGMTSRQFISAMVWEKYFRKPKTFEIYPSLLTRLKQNTALMSHIMLRSIDILREKEQNRRFEIAKPDVLMRPKVEAISLLDFSKYKLGIQAGIDAAEDAMPKILKLIEQKKEELNRPESSGSLEATQN